MKQTRARLIVAATLSIAVCASVMIAPRSGYAQDDVRARGDRACNTDAKKLCKKFFGQGDMVMLSCFQQNKLRLTRTCHKFLTDVGQLY